MNSCMSSSAMVGRLNKFKYSLLTNQLTITFYTATSAKYSSKLIGQMSGNIAFSLQYYVYTNIRYSNKHGIDFILLVFSVGGYDGQNFLNTVECYDPLSNQWSVLNPMTCRRSE